MLRVVLGIAVFAFTVYAVVDCVQTEEERVRHLPKLAWVVLILLFTPIAGIAWLAVGRHASLRSRLEQRPQRPRGPLGPDDDPDFLKNL